MQSCSATPYYPCSVLLHDTGTWQRVHKQYQLHNVSKPPLLIQHFYLRQGERSEHWRRLKARCTNVVHDLSSAEPRSTVEPSSRWITLQQVELGSADPVQLNGRGYSVDDADWSHTLGLWANYNDDAMFTKLQYRLVVNCSNF